MQVKVTVVSDDSTVDDIIEALGHVNADAKRCMRVVGTRELPTKWDARHGFINELLTKWEAARV